MVLKTKKANVSITEKDLDIKGEKFEFKAEELNQRESLAILEECGGEGDLEKATQMHDYMCEMFVRSVKSWSGIEDLDGKPLKCTEANKRAIYENNPDFCQSVVEKIAEKCNISKKK